jgi:hypothetical protein
MQKVPLAQRALLVLHDRDALSVEDEEVLLHRLRVVAAIRLPRLHDLNVDARVRPGHPIRFEPDERGSSRSSDRRSVAEIDHERLVDGRTLPGGFVADPRQRTR